VSQGIVGKIQRGLWHVWHSTTPRHFHATPILKLDLFLSFVMSEAVGVLEAGRFLGAATFFLEAMRNVVAANDGWC